MERNLRARNESQFIFHRPTFIHLFSSRQIFLIKDVIYMPGLILSFIPENDLCMTENMLYNCEKLRCKLSPRSSFRLSTKWEVVPNCGALFTTMGFFYCPS